MSKTRRIHCGFPDIETVQGKLGPRQLGPTVHFSGRTVGPNRPGPNLPRARVAQIGGTWERRSEEVEDGERKWEEMGGRERGGERCLSIVLFCTFLSQNVKIWYFCREMLKYATFCRETLKYGTFCRKSRTYALRENNSE